MAERSDEVEDIFPGWPRVGGGAPTEGDAEVEDGDEPTSRSGDDDDESEEPTSDDDDDAPARSPEEALTGKRPTRGADRRSSKEDEEEDEPPARRTKDEDDDDEDEPDEDEDERSFTRKYGNDTKKAAKGYWNAVRKLTSTARERDDLATRLADAEDRLNSMEGGPRTERRIDKDEEEPGPETDHDVKWYVDGLKGLADDKTALLKEQDDLLVEIDNSKTALAVAKARADDADADNKPRLIETYNRLVEAHNNKVATYKQNKAGLRAIEREIRVYERDKGLAERRFEAAKSQQKQAQAARVEYRAEQRRDFETFSRKAFKDSGLPEEMREDFMEDLSARCIATLQTLKAQDPNRPGIDLESLVGKQAEKVRRMLGGLERRAFTKRSKEVLDRDDRLRRGRDTRRARDDRDERDHKEKTAEDYRREAQFYKNRGRRMIGVGTD